MFESWLLAFRFVLIVFLIEWLSWILLSKFHKNWSKRMDSQYGKRLPKKLPSMATVIIIGPILEEYMFRGPIWLLQKLKLSTIVLMFACILFGCLFGLVHRLKKIEFERGVANLCWIVVLHVSINGILYGALVLLTHSLLPAIAAHALWNASICFLLKKGKRN